MKINMEKLNKAVRKEIPGTENSKNPKGFFGLFEPQDGYNKLVAYGSCNGSEFLWIHKEYLL